MRISQVKSAAEELVAMPRMVNLALGMAFVAMLFAAATLILIGVNQ